MNFTPTREGPRVNEEIAVPSVRLVDEQGRMVGVVTRNEALTMADQAGLDLVEVAPGADPPVCKILDYGKYKYEEQKKKNEARKKQKVIEVKEIKLRPGIDQHDYDVKMRSMVSFIGEGDKVKVTMRFRGRELAHQDLGMNVLMRVKDDLDTIAKVEQFPRPDGAAPLGLGRGARRQRAAEMIALRVRQSEQLELGRVRLVLDLLDDRGDAGFAAEAGDRAQQQRIARIAQRGEAEGAVDLHEVDLEAAQIVERVGAGAEIVEADLEAGGAQRLQARVDLVDPGDHRRFGELEEKMPRQPRLRLAQGEQGAEEDAALERAAREVDGDWHAGRRRIADHRDHLAADGKIEIGDQANRFGEGDGVVRRAAAAKARQRFDVMNLARAQGDDRLKDHVEGAVVHRRAQVADPRDGARQRLVEAIVQGRHREIGHVVVGELVDAIDQRTGGIGAAQPAVVERHRRAAQRDALAVGVHRLAERFDRLLQARRI